MFGTSAPFDLFDLGVKGRYTGSLRGQGVCGDCLELVAAG